MNYLKYNLQNYFCLASVSGLNNLSTVFKIIIIGIIYLIIFYALSIMYKDMKNGDRKQVQRKKQFGLEIVDSGVSGELRKGSVIPINREITIGRKEDNSIVLPESYVSGHHARIYMRNNRYIIEDLNSTNGTILNGDRLEERTYLSAGDQVKIGTVVLKVIG